MPLQEHLQEQEEQVDALLKTANRYIGALKAWKKACSLGHIANLTKSAQNAQEISANLPETTADAQNSWTIDVRNYLAGGEWREELEALVTEKHGLRVVKEDDVLLSSPVVVRAVPERGILMLGKVAFPTLHPKVVGAELKRLRDRAASANSQEFLERLYDASVYLSKGDKVSPSAKFVDIYNLWCLTPGYKKETSSAAFAQQIYALHRSEIPATRAGKKVEFEFATGNYKEKEVFTVTAEDGRPIRYFTLYFK